MLGKQNILFDRCECDVVDQLMSSSLGTFTFTFLLTYMLLIAYSPFINSPFSWCRSILNYFEVAPAPFERLVQCVSVSEALARVICNLSTRNLSFSLLFSFCEELFLKLNVFATTFLKLPLISRDPVGC